MSIDWSARSVPPEAGAQPVNFGDPRLPERFWSKVQPCPMSGCWLWVGANDGAAGYGNLYWEGRYRKAHRVAVEAASGSRPPDDLDVDHRCRVTCCVNPAHLEAVTTRENILRGLGPALLSARAKLVTSCPRGHDYSPGNTSIWQGHRKCKTCDRERHLRKYRARRAS